MTILVCAATRPEHSACVRGLAGISGFEVLLVGVGHANAGPALRARLASGAAPSLVVSAGFAGSLSAGLDVGDWMTASRLEANPDLTPVVAPSPAKPCLLVSSDVLAAETRSEMAAVDMESAALADACGALPFMVLRMVSDSPSKPLPSFLAPMTDAMTSGKGFGARLRSAARGVREAATNPRGVARLVKEGSDWTRQLAEGWKRFAPLVREMIRS